MKIGIIGAGNVGGAPGKRWAVNGHRVLYGSRDPQREKIRDLVLASGANARAATIRGAVEDSEMVVLVTPWDATAQVVQSIPDWTGKIVVDTTNPLYTERKDAHRYPSEAVNGFFRVMAIIRNARDERDLRALRSLHYEALKGNRSHQHSLRLNQQWRLIVERQEDADGRLLWVIDIEDYH